jgi:hypothetical protein
VFDSLAGQSTSLGHSMAQIDPESIHQKLL